MRTDAHIERILHNSSTSRQPAINDDYAIFPVFSDEPESQAINEWPDFTN